MKGGYLANQGYSKSSKTFAKQEQAKMEVLQQIREDF